MSDATAAVKKITADDLDFSQSPFFRNLRTIAMGNVKPCPRTGTQKVNGQSISVNRGDAIETISKDRSRYYTREKFDALWEVNREDEAFYRSKDTGRIAWIREPVIFVGADGTETPIDAGGGVFKSTLDGMATGYSKSSIEKNIARQLGDGSLCRLSEPVLAQYMAIMNVPMGDKSVPDGHWKDINTQHGKDLLDVGIKVGDTLTEVTTQTVSILHDIGTGMRDELHDAGKQLVKTAETVAPELIDHARKARARVTGFVTKWLGGGGDPPKPGK